MVHKAVPNGQSTRPVLWKNCKVDCIKHCWAFVPKLLAKICRVPNTHRLSSPVLKSVVIDLSACGPDFVKDTGN